jgi:hypothetical protein
MNCQTNKISMLAFNLQNYNQQLLLFGGDFAIGKLRVFVSFVAHDLNYLQELEFLAFRSAFDREDNRSSSQVVFGHRVLALAQAVQRGLLLSDSQALRQQQALQPGSIKKALRRSSVGACGASAVSAASAAQQYKRSPCSSSDGSVTSQSCGRLHAVH